jgi:creatinine amidohydrolase/Fe(II)-dependent formamide hydrolase-like protein
MQKLIWTICFGAITGFIAFGQAIQTQQEQVEIEQMTYPEIYSAIHNRGKTTVLIYNGGTEQRGPHAVLGGHSLMARAIAPMIAKKLGNALVAPVLPFAVSPAGGVDAKWPGSVALPPDVFQKVNEAVVDSMAKNGFKSIVLMGDHGGGQAELKKLAELMDAKYDPQGTHVYFCGDLYEKSRLDEAEWLKAKGLPLSNHGGIPDTSTMLFLQPGPERWVRNIYKTTVGDPVLPPGQKRDPKVPLVNNGVTGDPRPSTAEIGKLFVDIKVNDAVSQINKLIAAKTSGGK